MAMYTLMYLFTLSFLAKGELVKHITRDYFGDIFNLENCTPGSCEKNGRRAAEIPGEKCRCQCAPSHYTFREDMKQCIKDVGECPVAMFVRPFAVERIPLVFLPMTGQLVYPGAHLTVSGIARLATAKHLACNVKTSLLMTTHGWQPIRTVSQIFGVYYDGNKTFLQWLGEDDDRRALQHHLVLIRLQCEGENNNGTFEPCAALRIGWAPGLEPEAGEQIGAKNNFIIIGLCLGILGLIYVGAVLIYMKVRKNRRDAASPQNTVESIEVSCDELRNTYINNLVQEAEFTTKSSKSGSNYSTVTENGMKTLDIVHRKPETTDGINPKSQISKSNGQLVQSHARSSPIAEEVNSSAQPQEFFVRIRGMISAAKTRLNNFRYRPTLLDIPEDDYFYQDFKEKDMEASGNRKSFYKRFPKKGNGTTLNKLESFHGHNLGAAMLEAKLAPPLPPPRSTKPKSKKRAPSPPAERIAYAEKSGQSTSSLRDLGGSLDRKRSRHVNGDYSKFDLFRLDLYAKIQRMRDGDKDIPLEYSENKKQIKEDVTDRPPLVMERTECTVPDNSTTSVQYASVHQESKISRRQLLHKLQETEPKPEIENEPDVPPQQNEPSERDYEGCISEDERDVSESSDTGSITDKIEIQDICHLSCSSRPTTAMSNSSARTTSSQPSTMKENPAVMKETLEAESYRDDTSECSDTSEASLSGDSLNSSFRKPDKPLSALKIKKCLRSSEDLSVISGSTALSSSTAIKEIEDFDAYDGEDDYDMTQDDDSRLSTDLDGDAYSLEDSEHPSLEEYLQLSSQVAKKLSERTVPAFNNDCPKDKNVITQFMKDFKTTIGRLKTEDGKPRTSPRNTSPGSDNWTLKREEKRAKVSRRVSIFKRNPLKGRKNEEPLVTEESGKSSNYDSQSAIDTDDVESRSSTPSSVGAKKSRQRYKVKTPEIVPSTKLEEKAVISKMEPSEIRQMTRYTPSPVHSSGTPKYGKAISPPLPPPKPQIDPSKLKTLKALRNSHENSCETSETHINSSMLQNSTPKRKVQPPARYVRTPSIESDTISIANSDMTEDSLNTALEESEMENIDDISEDENGPIDRCLAQLADSVIQSTDDCSLNRYLSQLGTALAVKEEFPIDHPLVNKLANNANANRATKGFNLSLHLPLGTWEHVCVDKTSERSTPTSDRSSTPSRGSHGSQENLRKTLNRSKHHHHHHQHRAVECSQTNGINQTNSIEKFNNFLNSHHYTNGNDIVLNRAIVERGSHRRLVKGKARVIDQSEDEDCGKASSLGSTRELESAMSETTSDPGSVESDRPRRKRPQLRKSKKALNGTCRQHIQSSKLNRKENGSIKKVVTPARNLSTPHSSASDVTVIQLEGDSSDHTTNGHSSNIFVTLVNIDSSDCSISSEGK